MKANRVLRMTLCFGALLALGLPLRSQDRGVQTESQRLSSVEATTQIDAGTVLDVELAPGHEWKRIAKNSTVEGRFRFPIFAREQVAIPAGTKLSLAVESVKKTSNSRGKWTTFRNAAVRAFNPLQTARHPQYVVKLSKIEMDSPHGRLSVSATVLRAGRSILVEERTERNGLRHDRATQQAAQDRARARQVALLQLDDALAWPSPLAGEIGALSLAPPPRARAFLLTPLSASRSHIGDVFRAQLAEPVRLGEALFEAGSVLDGRVSAGRPPRMLSRAGSLYLRFERIRSPLGPSLEVAGTLRAVELDAPNHFALDDEGMLRGLKPGVKNALVDLGIAYAVGKITDDAAEAPIRAVGAAMSSAAVANAARYFGLGASTVFLVTRHGRDVNLPKYTVIEVDFGRLPQPPGTHPAAE